MVVTGVWRAPPAEAPVKRGGKGGGFRVRAEEGAAAGAAVGTTSVALASLLAMQEDESEARQDRQARQHGEAVLDELSGLHRALLGDDAADLERLGRLVERPIEAVDPGLAGVLRAVRLRAGIELARRTGDVPM